MTLQRPENGFERGDLALPAHLRDPARALVLAGQIDLVTALTAQATADRCNLSLHDVLRTRFSVTQRSMMIVEHLTRATRMVDPQRQPPDTALVHAFGPNRALQCGVLPWQRIGDWTVVLAPSLDVFVTHQVALEQALGQVRLALATPDQISGVLAAQFATALVDRAETRLPLQDSSRGWQTQRALGMALSLLVLFSLAFFAAPLMMVTVLTALAVVLLVLSGAIKGAAALVSGAPPDPPPRLPPDRLPVITLLIPLYREKAVADHLLTRLEALDYPRERLDVCLVLEDNDATTRAALGRARLLTWMRPIIVPKGTLRTKPRALNYALDFARGSIIGVYDAEDAPAPDQLHVVAATFAAATPDVACLQGVLDYYNAGANWLTRCFTIEYASWFRVILPGYARLGLVIPLGGTTLFFRRDVLDRLGGWDAHNVTEDADLGIRLARAGYRTAFMSSVTEEEANGRAWPWIKQRSRWLKGYGVTYAVHMRSPVQLWRDLGAWRFFGFQMLFAATLSQFLLAPLIWSFWLIPLGFSHPATQILPPFSFWTLVGLFVAAEVINLAIAALALWRADKRWLLPWALTLQVYFPLGAIAAWRGLLELTWKPFYWDKTAHGLLLPSPPATPVLPPILPPAPVPHPVSDA